MILITGADGQLGQVFKKILEQQNIDYISKNRFELNIVDYYSLEKIIKDKEIKTILNCAAYNNVDLAEKEHDICNLVNVEGVKSLAKISNEVGAKFITFSSNLVFDGLKQSPYSEEDAPNPLSVYGKSKLLGEREALLVNPNSLIIRTSWLFGKGKNNFVKNIVEWSKEAEELNIVDDQISSPTYTNDLAYYSLKLTNSNKKGLYHVSNAGVASKYDVAKYILEKIKWDGKLNKVDTNFFNTAANRGTFTKLSTKKIERELQLEILKWEEKIEEYLTEIL